MQYTLSNFASTYGSGPYGTSTYQNGSIATSGSTGAPASPGGGHLANTGFDLILAVSVASTIIFIALLVRFWKKPAKQQPPANVD